MITKLIGKRIAQLRHRLGLSQIAFAEQIGMARTYFAEVETGKRNVSVRNLEKIVGGLGVTLAEFFDSDVFDPLYDTEPTPDPRHEKRVVNYAHVVVPPLDGQQGDSA